MGSGTNRGPREYPESDALVVLPEVAKALDERRPVVALESTIISHGLPRPRNLEVAAQIEAAVRGAGAVPATIAVIGGRVHVGLSAAALERVALADDAVKLSLAGPAGGGREPPDRGNHGGEHRLPRRAQRHRGLRHRRAGRRPPRRRARRSTNRPTSTRWRSPRSPSSARASNPSSTSRPHWSAWNRCPSPWSATEPPGSRAST